ncbi:MAG: phosphoribosylanthranilate isomerase [Thermodesulfobacteriota bacterium]
MVADPNERLQVKICGLKDPGRAAECVALGADAIGLVFYPPSPRFVTPALAGEIVGALPDASFAVGVFANEPEEALLAAANRAGIQRVQLHGQEPPELVAALRKRGFFVIKALFATRAPGFAEANRYEADAFLVEAGRGRLPGGNAETWDWKGAAVMRTGRPFLLAGGLDEKNVERAVEDACPDGVDASSGLEIRPGEKDMTKVARFLAVISGIRSNPAPRRIFP